MLVADTRVDRPDRRTARAWFFELKLRPLPQRPERTVRLDFGERTIVDVPRRNGLPYLSTGRRVKISYSVCRNGEARLLLTRAIRQVR